MMRVLSAKYCTSGLKDELLMYIEVTVGCVISHPLSARTIMLWSKF
jgi:hypothetical protein